MSRENDYRPKIGAAKFGLLFLLFFLVAGGLGYPILNRYDPRQTAGLSDVKPYAEMVAGDAGEGNAGEGNEAARSKHVRFRVLVPWMARQVYVAVGRADPGGRVFAWSRWPASVDDERRVATWDPVMFSLLVADSFFVAATAVLIVWLGARCGGGAAVGLVAALLYMVNFAVPNLRLVGLVDAGEGFFLLALVGSFVAGKMWLPIAIAVFGSLTKETFIPFSFAFGAVWWLVERRGATARRSEEASVQLLGKSGAAASVSKLAVSILLSWMASIAAFMVLHRAIEGSFANPLPFGLGLHGGHDYGTHFAASLADRQLWYIFVWLLPTAIPKLRRFPSPWLAATGAACAVAFALDAYYGGAPGTVGRALFTIAGPMLSLSSAMFLVQWVG